MSNLEEQYLQNQLQFSQFAKALGHPARVMMLKFLEVCGTCSFGTLSTVVPVSKASTAQHLEVLKKCGLVTCKTRLPHVFYSLNEEMLQKARVQFDFFFNPMTKDELDKAWIYFRKSAPTFVETMEQAVDDIRPMVEARIRELQAKGLIDPSIDVASLSNEEMKAQGRRIFYGTDEENEEKMK